MAQFNFMSASARRWQDWVNLVLAAWLFISPWVLGFAGASASAPGGASPALTGFGPATWDAWILGVVIAIVALAALTRLAAWQEWVNLVLGIWVFIAPWVLAFSHAPNAAWDHWIVGALVFLVSLAGVAYARGAGGVGYAHAGDKPTNRP